MVSAKQEWKGAVLARVTRRIEFEDCDRVVSSRANWFIFGILRIGIESLAADHNRHKFHIAP